METKRKILLCIFPYWDPMIPPMGIATLKGFLQRYGYQVKTVDFIVKDECLDFYKNYFNILSDIVPDNKRGNFKNIGHDVLQYQMMSHQNYTDKGTYLELIKELIYTHYYVQTSKKDAERLLNLVSDYYSMLENFFLDVLRNFQPDVLGVTAFKCTVPSSLFACKLAKVYNKNIITLMGGGTFNESHAPGSPSFDSLLEVSEPYLDKIFLGQGELLLLSYLQGNLPDNKRVYTKNDIGNRILHFEEANIPDFSDLNLVRYPYLAATASASCIYDCSFCVSKKVNGEYRKKNPAQLVEEMTDMNALHGHQLFFMTDSLINPVITDVSKELIRQNKSFYFDAYFKVDKASADIKNTLLWRKGGLYRVRLGTESGSPKILDEMNKLITPEQIKASVKSLAYAGIKVTTYWVIGHPGETEEDFQMTLDLVEELKDDIYQAESNYFLYHYSKQGKENEWAKHREPLYAKKYEGLLVFKYWTLNLDPLREVIFERVQRFEEHCKKLGIPNPYSYKEHTEADKRWAKLHSNAVPPLMDFLKREGNVTENQNIIIPTYAVEASDHSFEFDFD